MSTFTDFKNSIGKKFKVVDGDGNPFRGLLGKHDTVIAVHKTREMVEGHFFIAHFSDCRLISDQPEQLKIKS